MADTDDDPKIENVDSLRDMHLKEEETSTGVNMSLPSTAEEITVNKSSVSSVASSGHNTPQLPKRAFRSPVKSSLKDEPGTIKSEEEELVGGDVTLNQEPGKPPKLSRSATQKVEKRPPPLFWDHDDKTDEATSTFSILDQCMYANKYLGTTEHALECDCAEEWDPATKTNLACGEDSDCINRATKMECIGDCGCGTDCQNQRFQLRQYAKVSVIKTEKKGYGLRVNTDLNADDFIFEYVGDVIGEQAFRKRMQQYDEEGIKHFYFMSLTKGEFVDATKRGNLGRFCNHSCNPNCYVDKWVVGDKLRMGIFAERKIQAGEELVFNYNVDRYGADPQPCYCAEPNCTGYIGGKTQTDRGTKLSNALIEALGIDEADAWDTAVAKRPRKKKSGEDDEEYVNNVEPKGLDEEGVNKVMSTLMQCKEKWIAVKLLARIQRSDENNIRNRVVRFHGYRIMKTVLSNFADDVNVSLQVLDVLDKMPRLTRNKIEDSKIEEAVAPLKTSEDPRVSEQATALLDAWSKLVMAYRIPRMKRDPDAKRLGDRKADRDDRPERRRSKSRSKSPDRLVAPTGPRNSAPSRPSFARPLPRPRPPPPAAPLPTGWFAAVAASGTTYYWNESGATTWQRPTHAPGTVPPPPPPKAVADQQMLKDLIKNIVSEKRPPSKTATPVGSSTPVVTPKKEVRKQDKWKSYPVEKQKKLYESAIQPHIMHVVGKYKHKLPKDDLKRWAKELAKKMVDSDFKKGRVENATRVSDKQAKGIRKHAQEFFEKAAKKKGHADEKKTKSETLNTVGEGSNTPIGSPLAVENISPEQEGDHMDVSDIDDGPEAVVGSTPNTATSPTALKRRISELANGNEDEETILKRLRTEDVAPPPPPPPPPGMEMEQDDSQATEGKVGSHEPTQTATPPTTGSPDLDESNRAEHHEQKSVLVNGST